MWFSSWVTAGTITGNAAFYYAYDGFISYGGGIYNAASGSLTLGSSTVLTNSALYGADLYNLGSAVISSDSTVGVIGP
jgi:hypothetical protein